MVAVLAIREHPLEQRLERLLGIAGLLGRRAADRRAQLLDPSRPHRRQLAQPLDVSDDPVYHEMAEAAHLVRWHGQRFGHPGLVPDIRLRLRWTVSMRELLDRRV